MRTDAAVNFFCHGKKKKKEARKKKRNYRLDVPVLCKKKNK